MCCKVLVPGGKGPIDEKTLGMELSKQGRKLCIIGVDYIDTTNQISL